MQNYIVFILVVVAIPAYILIRKQIVKTRIKKAFYKAVQEVYAFVDTNQETVYSPDSLSFLVRIKRLLETKHAKLDQSIIESEEEMNKLIKEANKRPAPVVYGFDPFGFNEAMNMDPFVLKMEAHMNLVLLKTVVRITKYEDLSNLNEFKLSWLKPEIKTGEKMQGLIKNLKSSMLEFVKNNKKLLKLDVAIDEALKIIFCIQGEESAKAFRLQVESC